MLARVYAPALFGLEHQLISIECDVTSGLPGLIMVGLGDKAIDEARERVRSAIKNSGLILPPKRLTLNLAPADLPKDGAGYDLGIAVAVLAATGQLRELPDDSLFIGELSLNGDVRPVRGALLAAQLARDSGRNRIYVPIANTAEASLMEGVDVIGVHTLLELYHHLIGLAPLAVTAPVQVIPLRSESAVSLDDIYGQDLPKRALQIAAAGGHNILFSGPPGSGKTMLAKALIGLLPPPSFDEMLEITKLASLARHAQGGIMRSRPFRAPHHSASSAALIGGGKMPRPGEISLAHHGVLFLDELPEFPRGILEMLRQPLEDGNVSVARASGSLTFPAQFILVATANPCPCGYFGDCVRTCSCTMSQVTRYRQKLSGPLLDRIDLVIDVGRVDESALGTSVSSDSLRSKTIADEIISARNKQAQRAVKNTTNTLNSRLSNAQLHDASVLTQEAQELARRAAYSLGLSARGYTKTLKVARTIADLAGTRCIETAHLTEALQYRSRL